jgi:hypothetical protein
MTRADATALVEAAIDRVNETVDPCTVGEVVDELIRTVCDDDLDILCGMAEARCGCGKTRYTECKGALANAVKRLTPDEWEGT